MPSSSSGLVAQLAARGFKGDRQLWELGQDGHGSFARMGATGRRLTANVLHGR